MLRKSSSGSLGNGEVTPIGTAISNGAGLYANEIQKARDTMESEYGDVIKNVKLYVAEMSDALGMSDGYNVYMSQEYSSNAKMTQAMKEAGKTGFHPKIGKKSGAEAVTAHELGHVLGRKASQMAGIEQDEIVARAGKRIGVKKTNVAGGISEYARYNYHETIAEAVADVYCNGRRASKNSRAIVAEIKSILKR